MLKGDESSSPFSLEVIRMVRFGVIGTSWITDAFIKNASLIEDFKLTAVYSRTNEKAVSFAAKYGDVNIFTDLETMANSHVIDAVYIASPNAYHAPQAILFLKNHKHVLCEKPIAANLNELKEMITAAKQHNVLLMEAMKTITLPNFRVIQAHLDKIGPIRRFFANYCQYSSRYDLYKAGENPNTFNPAFANGSLMDIGVYCVYPLIKLFGKPNEIKANGVLLESGVDGAGSISFKYEQLEGLIMHSKITDSALPSEIQGEQGNIIIDKIHTPEKVQIMYRNQEIETITVPQLPAANTMYYEIKEFIETIKAGEIQAPTNSHQHSIQVMEILQTARTQIGITYPGEA